METPQIAFGFEEPEAAEAVVPPFPDWGSVCALCSELEKNRAKAREKADLNYQTAAQNLAMLRLRVLRVKTCKSAKKNLSRMMRLFKIVNELRRESHILQDLMFEARDRSVVCLSPYGATCVTLAGMF